MKYLLSLFFATVCFAEKPNILWITIEDTSPQFIGCYGNPHARTPVIDRLAHDGVRFTNAFSTGTVCSPSRSLLITGVPTGRTGTGHHRSAYPIPAAIAGFPAFLKKAGYYTSNNFKTDYNIASAPRIIAESWHESSHQAGWWNRQPGQPFFAVFNFMESHQSRTMTDSYAKYREEVLDQLTPGERIGEDAFDLPPFYRDSPAMRRQMARTYNALKLTDKRIGEVLDRLKREGLEDNTIVFFFADHGEGIPRGKTNGIGLGYRVPMIIRLPPKYRALAPWKTGAASEELISFEDLPPTLLSLAGITPPDYMTGRVLLGNQRQAPPEFVFGSSDRSDESTDLVRSVTNGRYLYSRNFLPFLAETRWLQYQEISDIKQEIRKDYATGLLNADQSRMMDPRPAEFLFDLQSDPWELHNLAGTGGASDLLQKMRQAVDARVLQSRDVLFLPEYEMALVSRTTTPYAYRLNPADYPLEEIYAAARLSGKRGPEIAGRQFKLLQSPNKIVRYWAILGLKSQPAGLLQKQETALLAALKDDYAPVQIIAASLLDERFQNAMARDLLRKYALNADDRLALLALQAIAYLPDIKPFADVAAQVRAKGEKNHPDIFSASSVLLARLGIKTWEEIR